MGLSAAGRTRGVRVAGNKSIAEIKCIIQVKNNILKPFKDGKEQHRELLEETTIAKRALEHHRKIKVSKRD